MSVSGGKLNLGNKSAGGCGLVVFAIVLLIFLGVGSFMTIIMAREFIQTVGTYSWKPVAGEIVSSEVTKAGQDYQFQVEYRYPYNGEEYTSHQFGTGSKKYSDYRAAQQMALRYEAGSKTTCYVNPKAPTEAILQRGSLWFGFAVLFPLLFVAIGGGGLVFMVRYALKQRRDAGGEAGESQRAISESAKGASGKAVGRVFFGAFLVIGLIVFYFLGIRPVALVISARNWTRLPCTVVSSQVRSHRGDKSTTYSVDILYAYEIGGREYRANRYNFMGGSSSGRAGKAKIVRAHPPGKKTVCYVDRNDPTNAVLVRDFTPSMLLGLIPLVFVLIGAGGLLYVPKSGRQAKPPWRAGVRSLRVRDRAAMAAAASTGPSAWTTEDDGPKELKSAASPLGKFIGGILVAAFWNGIVSVFVWQAVEGWVRHRPDWMLTIFMVPFVLIGLGMIGFVGYAFLGLFNPRPRLVVTPGAVRLGNSFEVRWELRGRTSVLQRLRIHLEGSEEAKYRRGTKTVTDKSVFATVEVANTTDRVSLNAGQARVTVPPELMHSFESTHNKILWKLRVHGDIPRWPDIKEEFPVTILPRPPVKNQPQMSMST